MEIIHQLSYPNSQSKTRSYMQVVYFLSDPKKNKQGTGWHERQKKVRQESHYQAGPYCGLFSSHELCGKTKQNKT